MYLNLNQGTRSTQYSVQDTYQSPALHVSYSGGYGYLPLTTSSHSGINLQVVGRTTTYFVADQNKTTTTTCYTTAYNSEGMSDVTALTTTEEGAEVTTSAKSTQAFNWYSYFSATQTWSNVRGTIHNSRTTSKTTTKSSGFNRTDMLLVTKSMRNEVRLNPPDSTITHSATWDQYGDVAMYYEGMLGTASIYNTILRTFSYSYTGAGYNSSIKTHKEVETQYNLLYPAGINGSWARSWGQWNLTMSVGPNETVPASMYSMASWTHSKNTFKVITVRAEKTTSQQTTTIGTATVTTTWSGITETINTYQD